METNKLLKDIDWLRKQFKDMKNELCFHCGKYKQEHLGACDGCRWRET